MNPRAQNLKKNNHKFISKIQEVGKKTQLDDIRRKSLKRLSDAQESTAPRLAEMTSHYF